MAAGNEKIGRDLRRLQKRIAAGKKAMQKTETKAENLEAAIRSAMDLQEHSTPRQKSKKPNS